MPETYAFERSKDMRKKKVTSSDIAHAAGVSQATVSMILNKKYNVSFSKETIRKVEQIAEEMGYEVPKRKTRRESRKEKIIGANQQRVMRKQSRKEPCIRLKIDKTLRK